MKSYDRSYFDRWYRDPVDRVATRDTTERKARMAVSLAEFMLGRHVRSVLDVGCGEASWYPILRRMRPKARYIGVDTSDYVLEEFGKARNIRRGSLGTLHRLRLPQTFDLIVCADVLQYVPTKDVERGLRTIRAMVGGIAYIESFATEDGMVGDRAEWHERSAVEYGRLFHDAGLTQCGPYCYLDLDAYDGLNTFEHW